MGLTLWACVGEKSKGDSCELNRFDLRAVGSFSSFSQPSRPLSLDFPISLQTKPNSLASINGSITFIRSPCPSLFASLLPPPLPSSLPSSLNGPTSTLLWPLPGWSFEIDQDSATRSERVSLILLNKKATKPSLSR